MNQRKKPTAVARLRSLRTKLDSISKEVAKAEGALDQLSKQLEEFDCDSIEEAEELLEEMNNEIKTDSQTLETATAEFLDRWSEQIEEWDC